MKRVNVVFCRLLLVSATLHDERKRVSTCELRGSRGVDHSRVAMPSYGAELYEEAGGVVLNPGRSIDRKREWPL